MREQWTPPPDWKPPKKAVVVISWYDSGKRLVGSWYDAGIRITAPAAETASALDELWYDAEHMMAHARTRLAPCAHMDACALTVDHRAYHRAQGGRCVRGGATRRLRVGGDLLR